MSTTNKNPDNMKPSEAEENKNKKTVAFSKANHVKTYNPNVTSTRKMNNPYANPYANARKQGQSKKETLKTEYTKMAKGSVSKKQNKKHLQTKLSHPNDIKNALPKTTIPIKLGQKGSKAKLSHELFKKNWNKNAVIDLMNSFDGITLPNFDKEAVVKAFCKEAGIQNHEAVLNAVTYGKILKILISFRDIEKLEGPQFFKAIKRIVEVCYEIDPNMRIVLIKDEKYESESKITYAQFDENKAQTYVYDEEDKKHTNKVIFVRTCIPNLGRLLAVWIRHNGKHRIYPSNFLVLQTADVVYFVNADAKSVNIASLTKLVEAKLLPEINFHIYDKTKYVWEKASRKLIPIHGLYLQTHIKETEEAAKRMLAGGVAILQNNYSNMKIAPSTYNQKRRLERECHEEHVSFMKCKQEFVVQINTENNFVLRNVMIQLVNLKPETVKYNLFPIVDIFQNFLVVSYRAYDLNIALSEFTQVAEYNNLDYEIINTNEYELEYDIDGSFDEIDIAEDDRIDPLHEESPLFKKTLENPGKDTPEKRATIEWLENTECGEEIMGLPTDDERYDIEPDELLPTDENGALLQPWDHVEYGEDEKEEETSDEDEDSNLSDHDSTDDDGDDSPDSGAMTTKRTQEKEEEEYERELQKAVMQAEEEEKARKEAQVSTSYAANNPQETEDSKSKNSTSKPTKQSFKNISLFSQIKKTEQSQVEEKEETSIDETVEIHESDQVTLLQKNQEPSQNDERLFPTYEQVTHENMTKQELYYFEMKRNMTDKELQDYNEESEKTLERTETRYKKMARREAAATAGKMFLAHQYNVDDRFKEVDNRFNNFDTRISALEDDTKDLRKHLDNKMEATEKLDKKFSSSIVEMRKKHTTRTEGIVQLKKRVANAEKEHKKLDTIVDMIAKTADAKFEELDNELQFKTDDLYSKDRMTNNRIDSKVKEMNKKVSEANDTQTQKILAKISELMINGNSISTHFGNYTESSLKPTSTAVTPIKNNLRVGTSENDSIESAIPSSSPFAKSANFDTYEEEVDVNESFTPNNEDENGEETDEHTHGEEQTDEEDVNNSEQEESDEHSYIDDEYEPQEDETETITSDLSQASIQEEKDCNESIETKRKKEFKYAQSREGVGYEPTLSPDFTDTNHNEPDPSSDGEDSKVALKSTSKYIVVSQDDMGTPEDLQEAFIQEQEELETPLAKVTKKVLKISTRKKAQQQVQDTMNKLSEKQSKARQRSPLERKGITPRFLAVQRKNSPKKTVKSSRTHVKKKKLTASVIRTRAMKLKEAEQKKRETSKLTPTKQSAISQFLSPSRKRSEEITKRKKTPSPQKAKKMARKKSPRSSGKARA